MNEQPTGLIPIYEQSELMPYVEDDKWRRAVVSWLSGKRRNTQKAYYRIQDDFFKMWPVTADQVTADMVTAYKLHLQSLGRKDTTVAQRLAGLSSYFDHLVKSGMLDRNPVDRVERRDLDDSPYGNARPMSLVEFAAIMAQFDPATVSGAMYQALILAYTLTGRRRSEILRLRGRDIADDGDRMKFRVRMKGGKVEYRTMPKAAWAAINHYLAVSGRTLNDDDPLFIATHPTGNYFDTTGQVWVTRSQGEALSGTAAAEAIKRAAKRAGVDPRRVSIHGMRHLAAKLYKKTHGNDMRGLQRFLGHANIATTQIYDQVMSGDDTTNYDAMAGILAVAMAT